MAYRRRTRGRNAATAQTAIASATPALAAEPVAAPARAVADLPALVIRAAASEEDVAAIHAFMLHNAAAEMAEATIDPRVCMQTLWHTYTTGACLMAVLNDHLVGYLGLIQSQYDHSLDFFMHDKWFFVLPDHRDGNVARALLNEAKGIAEHAGMNLKIIDTTAVKPRRAKGQMALTAEIIGFRPHGRIFTVYPSRTN